MGRVILGRFLCLPPAEQGCVTGKVRPRARSPEVFHTCLSSLLAPSSLPLLLPLAPPPPPPLPRPTKGSGAGKFKSILGNSSRCLGQLKSSTLWIGRCGFFFFFEHGLKKNPNRNFDLRLVLDCKGST